MAAYRRAPHGDARRLVAPSFQPRKLGEEGHRHRQIDADAQPHHKARACQNIFVGRQRAGQCGDHKEKHIRHKDAITADFIGQPAADQRADDRPKGDGGSDHAAAGGSKIKLPRHIFHAERQRAKIVGVQKTPPRAIATTIRPLPSACVPVLTSRDTSAGWRIQTVSPVVMS